MAAHGVSSKNTAQGVKIAGAFVLAYLFLVKLLPLFKSKGVQAAGGGSRAGAPSSYAQPLTQQQAPKKPSSGSGSGGGLPSSGPSQVPRVSAARPYGSAPNEMMIDHAAAGINTQLAYQQQESFDVSQLAQPIDWSGLLNLDPYGLDAQNSIAYTDQQSFDLSGLQQSIFDNTPTDEMSTLDASFTDPGAFDLSYQDMSSFNLSGLQTDYTTPDYGNQLDGGDITPFDMGELYN